MKEEVIEKIYAGWLGKIIGIRLGAPVESWTYEKIRNTYGSIDGYLVDYREFAADDDSNGPLFFLRALEEGRNRYEIKAADGWAVDVAGLAFFPAEMAEVKILVGNILQRRVPVKGTLSHDFHSFSEERGMSAGAAAGTAATN